MAAVENGGMFCVPLVLLLLVIMAMCSVGSQWDREDKFLGQVTMITVDRNGTDDYSCINGNHSCHTLSYVLEQTLNGSRDGNKSLDYVVTVSDDQVMPAASYVLPKNTNMTVQGVGEMKVTLSCKDGRGDIVFTSASLGLLAWENVHWFNCSSTLQIFHIQPALMFVSFDILLFNRSMVSNFNGQIVIHGARIVEIHECFFTLNIFSTGPFFTVIFAVIGTFRSTSSVFVENSSSFYSFQLFNSHSMSISIRNSTIERNGGVFVLLRLEPLQNIHQNVTIEIAQNNFSNNTFEYAYDISWDHFLGTENNYILVNYNIFDNQFLGNSILSFFRHDEYNNAPYGISSNFFLSGNRFESNRGTFLTISANSYQVVIADFVFQNNSASNYIINLECITCNINFTGITVANSSAQGAVKISTINDAYTHLQYNMTIKNSTFVSNKGTALIVNTISISEHVSYLILEDDVTFINNSGVLGGALNVNDVAIKCSDTSIVRFENNVAHYGGALYATFPNLHECKELQDSCDFTFTNNAATTSGRSVFTGNNNCSCFEYHTYDKPLSQSISSLPSTVLPNPQDTAVLKLFPGQNLVLDYSVLGCFKSLTSCVADVSLICSPDHELQQQSCIIDGIVIRLNGIAGIVSVLLFEGPISTYLSVTTSKEPSGVTLQPHLNFQCQMDHTVEYTVALNITVCPIGLEFNSSSLRCQCVSLTDSNFNCSPDQGQVCVHRGYWVGSLANLTVIAACPLPFCDSNGKTCPSQASSDLDLLQQSPDRQCLGNHGGTLCRECTKNYTFTFEATQCIPVGLCKESWKPYALLVLAIGYQLMLAFLIILLLRLNIRNGLGYLYGPLFFIAIINNIPLANNPYIKKVISIYSSVLLLNLEIFGYIPWCFFTKETLSPLDHYAFYFLGPMVTALVILLAVIIARFSAKRFLAISKFPVRAICVLLLLSFWSLANTSLQILTFFKINGENETLTNVALYPDLSYLSEEHIPLWIVSVLVLMGLIIPFAFLLLLAPFLSRRCNLTRVKPLLDEFQSCYRDNYRWYVAVYFFAWIVLRAMLLINEYGYLQIVLVLLVTAHVVTVPYESRWLNAVDTLLLVDLSIISSLFHPQNSEQYEVLLDAMLLLPLVYVTTGFVYLLLKQAGCIDKIRHRCCLNRHNNNRGLSIDEGSIQQGPRVPVMVVGLDTNTETEPLLNYESEY